MTETTNPAELMVERQLTLTEAMLLPAAFRRPVQQHRRAPRRFHPRLLLMLGTAVLLIAATGTYGRYYWTVESQDQSN
jgi:hypothetical protein